MAPSSSLPRLNITDCFAAICRDMTLKVPALNHIDMNRVAVGFCQTRNNSKYGMYASLTPLRFPNGERTTIRRGRQVVIQKIQDATGADALYLLNFYLPRFYLNDFPERLRTITHELWHISPKFNGDIRRLPGRCYAHSGSQKNFDAVAAQLAQAWLATNPDPRLYSFLQCSFQTLIQNFVITGQKYGRPKIITLPDNN
ncbi:MAG: hypothetical protein IJH67_09640 [Thermoguttaceae bacterium]|jgi:hypothetical protein|nr:hypothetical protein [Thermoguttaceae bacterium]